MLQLCEAKRFVHSSHKLYNLNLFISFPILNWNNINLIFCPSLTSHHRHHRHHRQQQQQQEQEQLFVLVRLSTKVYRHSRKGVTFHATKMGLSCCVGLEAFFAPPFSFQLRKMGLQNSIKGFWQPIFSLYSVPVRLTF